MSQTFIFEELDDDTREYLTKVRAVKGNAMPGIFAETTSAAAVVCLIFGLIIAITTPILTLTNAINVVYDNPVRVALLQTAGFMLSGWLLVAFFRMSGKRGDRRKAGHWVYMDPLNLYVAFQEQVAVTRVDDVSEAHYTHHYNNGNYQNSTVTILMGDGTKTSFTLNKESRAEQFVVFANYLGWARGTDGNEVGKLPPATLGAVAKYVAKHDVEPKNADGAIDLSRVELDIEEVPEEPQRAGRATPSFLPYIIMLIAAALIFVAMGFVVNPPVRDGAIYSMVMSEPTEPRILRVYLMDPDTTLYRNIVSKALSAHYEGVIRQVSNKAQQPELQLGMLKVLTSLREEPNQPIVSLRVTEKSPDAISGGATNRVKKLREELVGGDGEKGPNGNGILDVFGKVSPPVRAPEGVIFTIPPPPIGHQLIAFVEPPPEAKDAHFEISYEFISTSQPNIYLLSVTVEIRESIDGQPIATFSKEMSTYNYGSDDASLDQAIVDLRSNLVKWLVGTTDEQ